MNVLVVADGHYYITPDGTVYADSVYDYKFYKRYLQVFDHVYAVVRAEDVAEDPKGKKKCSGEGVSFLRVPNYHGPFQYLQKYFEIRKCVKQYCRDYECAIFRIPAATSNIFCKFFKKTRKPFAVEVVIDPWENFSPRAVGNPAVLFIVRRVWTNLVKTMCAKANGASYVTEHYLQKLYPPRAVLEPGRGYFTSYYSSVELGDNSFSEPRTWSKDQKHFTISHVANYFNDYGKGHLVLMDAVRIVREQGFDVSLCFVGDGPMRAEFEQYAKDKGIADAVTFAGRLPSGDEVRKIVHDSDLFVLPTFAEGLPRALLEAMAEGLPCLSSPTCGIPEVLDPEYLYAFDDVQGFARGIMRFFTDAELMTREGGKNLETAKKYASSLLNKRRREFYSRLRESTQEQ